jgi:membrane protein implicated in regulation of membrane protease activity
VGGATPTGTVIDVEQETLAVVFVVLAVALCALEIVAPGLVLLPFGIGAAAAALVGFLGGSVLAQCGTFVVVSFAAFLAMRPLARRLNRSGPSDGIGAQRLIGARGVVLEHIAGGDTGLVRIDREEWRAESESGHPLPPGLDIQVVDMRGTRVVVVPAHTEPLGNSGGSPT